MTNSLKIILAIAVVVVCVLFYSIHSNNIDSKKKADIEKLQSENDSIKGVLAIKKNEANIMKKQIDSLSDIAGKIAHDTVYIRTSYDKKINRIKHLGIDSSIADVAKRLGS
jgi:hypothetical protein